MAGGLLGGSWSSAIHEILANFDSHHCYYGVRSTAKV